MELVEEPVDWILLGDSACGAGLSPAIMENALGESALNLCTTADASLVNSAWMLAEYLRRVPPPKGVVVISAFHAWSRPTDPLVEMFDQIPLPIGFWRTEAPPIEVEPQAEIALMFEPFVTLYQSNLSAQYVVRMELAQLRGQEIDRVSAQQDLEFVTRHRGLVQESTPNPEKVIADTAAHIAAYGEQHFELDQTNRRALEAITRLSQTYQFRHYAAHTSMARGVYDDPGIRRYMREIESTVTSIIDEAPDSAFIFSEPPQFEPNEMNNIDHVVGDDAVEEFTLGLVAEIRAATDEP